MDLPTIKSKDDQAIGTAPKGGSPLQLANIAATFDEIMKKTGAMLPAGSNTFAEQAQMVTPPDKVEAPRPAKADSYVPRDAAAQDDRDRDRVSQNQDRRDDAQTRRADAADDRPRDDAAKNDSSPRQDKGDAPQKDASAADDSKKTKDDSAAGDATVVKADDNTPQDAKPTAKTGDKKAAAVVQAATDADQGQTAVNVDANTVVQAAPVVTAPVQTAADPTPVVASSALAAAAAGAAAAGDASKPQNAAKPGEHGLDAKAKDTAPVVTPQAAPAANIGDATDGTAGNKDAQQSAALARALGGKPANDPIAQADDEASATGDRPATTTAPTSSTATDTSRPTQSGQPGSVGNALSQALAQNAQQAAVQAQTAQQAATTQQAASADAKAAVQGVQSAGPASASAAGGEAGVAGQPANTNELTHGPRTAAAQAPQPPRFVQAGPGFSEQISVHIAKAAADGLDRINIQMRPAELGRIEVQINVGADGQVSAAITADNRATLDLLQRDSRNLEQALQNAGLDVNSGDLTFNLRERQDQGQPDDSSRLASSPAAAPVVEEPPLEDLLNPAYRGDGMRADGRVNILT